MDHELKSKRIAVTGSAGFIGSYLAKKLLQEEEIPVDQLISVDKVQNFITRPCSQMLRDRFVKNKTPEVFLDKLEQLQPEIIFHMGACSSTEMQDWDYLQKVNVDYSKALWKYCCQNDCQFFYASSAATYGDGSQGFDDSLDNFNKLQPLNLYGKSKLLFDQFVREEEAQGRTPKKWAGFKFFNVYGPGEEHKGGQASVVQHASKQILETGQVKLFKSHHPDFEDGKQLRDFVYVGDIKSALFEFAKEDCPNDIYNLGTGKAQSFIDLVAATAQALEKELKIEFIPTPEKLREHYQYFTEAKMDKLTKALKQKHAPTLLKEGVSETLRQMNL